MATGVIIKEKDKAISVWGLNGECYTLPQKSDKALLIYPNKEDYKRLLEIEHKDYYQVYKNTSKLINTIPQDCFILDDNFYALKNLLHQNIKVKIFYLDPPYATGFDFQSRDLRHSYGDNMGQAEYLEFIRRRLILMRECLDDDGSIYVHIGHQMLGHLKVLMDEIFGSDKCRNIITRRKCSSKNFTKKQFANINDFILFYTKSNNYIWNQQGIKPDKDWIDREYPKIDEYGRKYKLVPIYAPGTRNGSTGLEWKGMKPPQGKHWQYTPDKLTKLDEEGDIYWSKNGNPRRKVYLQPNPSIPLTDYWEQYRDAHHQSIKITGYPTEKNLDMLKMIISSSSNEGDLVVDPFCGSGSFLSAAYDLKRKYIGIDSSFVAAETILKRMKYGTEKMGSHTENANFSVSKPFIDDLLLENENKFIVEKNTLFKYEKEIFKIHNI